MFPKSSSRVTASNSALASFQQHRLLRDVHYRQTLADVLAFNHNCQRCAAARSLRQPGRHPSKNDTIRMDKLSNKLTFANTCE
jgi:hypothetical protein